MRRISIWIGLLMFAVQAAALPDGSTFGRASESSESRIVQRQVAVGLIAGGLVGRFGAQLELNFTKRTGFLLGYGQSTDFQSFFIGGKHALTNSSAFFPYFSGGYAQWFSGGRGGSTGRTTPAFAGERFLSDRERNEGRFAEHILHAALGLQLFKSSGEFAGSSIYLEGIGLVDIDDLVFEPTLGLGYLYYF